MSNKQLQILQHSVGADRYGRIQRYATRNHFCAGGDDIQVCRELVALGLMREHSASELTGGAPLFTVTDTGRTAMRSASPVPPKLTASQKRYREFLDSGAGDCGYTFGTWLKRGRLPAS